MSIEVASGLICARTGYIVYDLATTPSSCELTKEKRITYLGFLHENLYLTTCAPL
jgi:hypothetical protein